jgi:low affinity Fe/Cu permease
MTVQQEKNWLESVGCGISEWVSDVAGHPFAQLGFVILCVVWLLIGWNVNILTAALSILAITLTQMVLNSQKEREFDAHRRDVAMHAKLDELIAASRRARNDLVGVEDRDEVEIAQLKEDVKDVIDHGGRRSSSEGHSEERNRHGHGGTQQLGPPQDEKPKQ